MYPDTNAGAMIEWAWGVSRLIDGLYKTTGHNIDLKRIAVTGCSFQGKMALYAGAFDERIALTIPEESGGGGEASWRVMATQTGTEDLEAAQGTAWYARNLLQFKNADAPKLPVDMHELVALVAPRAILTDREHQHRPPGQRGRLRFDEGRHRGLQGARRSRPDRLGPERDSERTAHSRATSPRTSRRSSTSSSPRCRTRTRTSPRARTVRASRGGSPGPRLHCSKRSIQMTKAGRSVVGYASPPPVAGRRRAAVARRARPAPAVRAVARRHGLRGDRQQRRFDRPRRRGRRSGRAWPAAAVPPARAAAAPPAMWEPASGGSTSGSGGTAGAVGCGRTRWRGGLDRGGRRRGNRRGRRVGRRWPWRRRGNAAASAPAERAAAPRPDRRRLYNGLRGQSFNSGWKFNRGDVTGAQATDVQRFLLDAA